MHSEFRMLLLRLVFTLERSIGKPLFAVSKVVDSTYYLRCICTEELSTLLADASAHYDD